MNNYSRKKKRKMYNKTLNDNRSKDFCETNRQFPSSLIIYFSIEIPSIFFPLFYSSSFFFSFLLSILSLGVLTIRSIFFFLFCLFLDNLLKVISWYDSFSFPVYNSSVFVTIIQAFPVNISIMAYNSTFSK